MKAGLSSKVLAQVEADFPPANQDEVAQVLALYAGQEPERVQLDILVLAAGDVALVYEHVERAQRDYRDILFWAENPDEARLDTPEKRERMRELFRWLGVKLPAWLDTGSES